MDDDDAAFDDAVRTDFLAGGLARGERLLVVGERVIDRSAGRGGRPFNPASEALAAGGHAAD